MLIGISDSAWIRMRDVMAFLKSIVRIGVFSTASVHDWRMIVKTLAIELAIYGLNFKEIARKMLRSAA